ncbi:hypothetical protein [Actinoplanes sp. NPDC051494]|uniref:hypothetical protein n=1 Tax=Actinoplanes sp. NPDC051494 TaxID=3363907 RepID=UPI0037A96D16
MTQPAAPPKPPAPKGALPKGVVMARYWKETPTGPAVRHDHERPVLDETEMPVGVWWMCPAGECPAGEWVFPRTDGELARPKKQYCADHGGQLLSGRSESTDGDPKVAARGRLQQAITAKKTAVRQAAADAANARIAALRAAGREEAAHLRSNLREHVPSAGVSLAALVTDWALIENLDGFETYALGTGLAIGGVFLAYWAVYLGEIVYARRMGYTLKELPRAVRQRAMSHARWVAAGILASGVWLVMGEMIGARLNNWQGVLANLMAAVLIGVVNYNPWAEMVQRRKDAARTKLEAAEAAARAEEQRLADLEADRLARQEEAETARRAAEEAASADAKKIVLAEDDRVVAGHKFAERWAKLAEDAKARSMGPGFEIWRTVVVADATRKLTAKVDGEQVIIGHEFLVRAEPGVLAPRNGANVSPFLQMKTWLSSMLELTDGMLDLAYQPKRLTGDNKTEPQTLINHGLVTLFDSHPLGANINHPGTSGVHIDAKGSRWGFAGHDLRGRPVHRRQWTPGQAGGGNRVGVTGTGKSVVTQVVAYNDLLLGILPIIHDAGKNAMDFVDFYGIVPVGHTIEHREVIRESLWAEMKRRQAWINTRTATGLGGMEVTADPTWDTAAGGPPIRAIWEEFHMHMRDQKFVKMLGEMIRLQRATAIMAETATQGSGLADMGDQNLKEQLNEIMLQMMRVSDHTARLAGYSGGLLPSSLPSLPGMMVMQELKGEPVGYRSAYIPRDPMNPDSLIYRMKQPNGTPEGQQILFAPELPAETIEVFTQYGLIDLWELGKTKSGREQLQAEADPVESTVYPPDLMPAAVAKPKMRADDVVIALLKHDVDQGGSGLTQPEMLASGWWKQTDGEWQKNKDAIPAASTVHRACNRMSADDTGLIAADESSPARWSLRPAGLERGEQSLMVLRAAGLLGSRARQQSQQTGVDVSALERQAMLEAEQAALMKELVREAAEAMGSQP